MEHTALKKNFLSLATAVTISLAYSFSGIALAFEQTNQNRAEAFKSARQWEASRQGNTNSGHAAPATQSHAVAENSSAGGAHAPETSAHAPAQTANAHATPTAPGGHGAEGISGDEALVKLLEGNERFISSKTKGPNRSSQRRTEVVAGQKPIAVVVTCSDSRLPPEILLDQGIGDIFVVRTAGNIVDDIALGSIEYAIDHLGSRLVLVLGHTKCGAVGATVAGGQLPGHLPSIVTMIQPAVDQSKDKQGDLTTNAIKANVKLVARKISQAVPQYIEMIEEGELRIAGGVYDLESGKVTLTYRPAF